MRSFKRGLLLLLCLLGQPPLVSRAQDADTERLEFQALSNFVRDRIEAAEMSGAVVMAAREGEVVFHEAFGLINLETKRDMPRDAIFRLASMTKPIVSVAVMKLFDEGHFSLNDPITDHLPEFRNITVLKGNGDPTEDARLPITIGKLLTHTSGIADITHKTLGPRLLELEINPYWCAQTLEETVGKLATLPLMHQPAERWEYGFSTDVLGRLIEKVTNKSLDEYLRDELFSPLGMRDTHFYLPPDKVNRLAAVCELTPLLKLRQISDGWHKGKVTFPDGFTFTLPYRVDALYAPTQPRRHFSAVGGLCATASDYMRFCQMLASGGEWNGVRILRHETVQMMTKNQIKDKTVPAIYGGWQKFGLGFGIMDDRNDALHEAYGWGGAYATYFWVHPRSRGIFILMAQVAPTSARNCLDLGPSIKDQAARVLNPQDRRIPPT
jgi:CubicO group peptidase (beta-lactamase class C family)